MKFQLVELENLKLEESQNMHKAVIYIHGKGGTSSESEHSGESGTREALNFTEENMDKNEKWLQWAVLFFLPF